MRLGTIMAAAAFVLGFSDSVAPAAARSYNRRRRNNCDKHTRGHITVQANGGRLTKRGKRGYGMVPADIKPKRAALYLNSHARDMAALRAALA